MNSVKRAHAALMITFFLLIAFLPSVLLSGQVFAQSAGYSITGVDYTVGVMYTGQTAIEATIHVSGQLTDGFMIGLPSNYSAYVLKALAYSDTNLYQINLGIQLGNRSGFYGAEVNFNGNSPSVFTVAFILSSSILSYNPNTAFYTLNYPAYPSFTQDAASCSVTVTLPSTPPSIDIIKSDGEVTTANYAKQNLPAYTYETASATFQQPVGTLQFADLSMLNRQIAVDPTGKVTASDKYYIINNATASMPAFIFGAPPSATNLVIQDELGNTLTTKLVGTVSYGNSTTPDILLENATLSTALGIGQSTIITAKYNLPSATLEGSQYILANFTLFPDFYYYVDQATCTITPPQGATILTPQVPSLDASATLTRNAFQDTLTITREGVSYVDFSVPQSNIVQLSFDYNPVWVSFLPTLWASLLAVIGCIGAVFITRRKPNEKEPTTLRRERLSTPSSTVTTPSQQTKGLEPGTGQRITEENIREFTDLYEEKKQLNTELKSLDARAQKGKIPRRQYKVQRKAIEIRLEALARNTSRLKNLFRSSGSAYSDLIKQLDSAEANLAEAEENIKNLESQENKGEISIETYKKNSADYQKRKDKMESTINGILLRLREKAR